MYANQRTLLRKSTKRLTLVLASSPAMVCVHALEREANPLAPKSQPRATLAKRGLCSLPIEAIDMLSAKLNVSKESWRVLLRNLLILLAVIAGVAYSAFLIVLPFGLLSQPETRLAVFLVGSIIGELAALLVLIWLLARKQTRLSDLGLAQPTTWQAIVLGVVVAFVYSGLTALNPMVGANLLSFSSLKALAIMTAVIAGVVEEIIFRGYVMTVLARMGYRSVVQVLVSAIAFAIAHLYGFGSPGTMLATQGMTLLLGIALGTVYVIGKRSLTPVMVSHILIDTIVEPWLLLSFFHL